jgi:rSAM/selenodomain-associated transferase 1
MTRSGDTRAPRDALLLLSKAPEPGRVKTRLAAEVGDELAARVQRAFLDDLGALGEGRPGLERVLCCAPSVEHEAFEALGARGWRRWPQGEGDLGERLTRLLRRALDKGAERVAIIGSDSPTLPWPLVERAFAALDACDVAVGPVFDGGYYLIAARRADTPAFVDIPWGTERAFDVTLRRLAEAGVQFRVLPFWYDVDTRDDVRRMANHLGLAGPYGPIEAPATGRLLAETGLARS